MMNVAALSFLSKLNTRVLSSLLSLSLMPSTNGRQRSTPPAWPDLPTDQIASSPYSRLNPTVERVVFFFLMSLVKSHAKRCRTWHFAATCRVVPVLCSRCHSQLKKKKTIAEIRFAKPKINHMSFKSSPHPTAWYQHDLTNFVLS